MIWNPFRTAPNFLGVDIGTSSVKIVELSRLGNRKKLENYGEMLAASLYEKPFRTFEKSTLSVSANDVARAISAILEEAKMKSRKAYFSIPDFSSFFTTFNLPSMTEDELPEAIKYEARQHIPLPLSEVTLDWQKIDGNRILLVAVPNEVIQQYLAIAKQSELELLALEAEVFGLIRALAKSQEKTTAVLVDMGARSTTINIIDEAVLKVSHSFDIAGNDFTSLISKGFNISYKEAEQLKKKRGIAQESILPLIDLILNEIKKILQNFFSVEHKEVQKVIIAGGSALLPGIADYFSKNLNKTIEIANPFTVLYYPPILEDTLKEMGPSFAIAIGTAQRGLE